jgi:hypothetical protein
VLVPGGLLALWCYSLLEVEPAFDVILRRLHDETLDPDWLAPRALVVEGYRSLVLPFPEEPFPAIALERELPLGAVLAYVATWSALPRHRARTGRDALGDVAPALARAWGDPERTRLVRWPLHLRVARKPRA